MDLIRLRTHQRNLYNYFLRNRQNDRCSMPSHGMFGVHADSHIRAINALQRMKLIDVDRPSDNYLLWTMRTPCHVE